MFLLVLNVLIFTGTVYALRHYESWQCAIPQLTRIYDVVSEDTQHSFDMTGHSPWMVRKLLGVECQQNGLMHIPQGLHRGVEILNLNKNSITRVTKNDFKSYTSLVALLLAENCAQINVYGTKKVRCSFQFLQIDSKAFSNLRDLTYLDLSGNSLIKLPGNLPPSLLALDIFFTSISPIQSFEVARLTSLQFVLLSSNCVGGDLIHLCKGNFTVENLVFASQNVSYINLAYNNMKRIPNWLFTPSLVGINLRGNPFRFISKEDFTSCGNLTELQLAWTSKYDRQPLTILPGALENLVNLRHLDLSGNMLSAIPNGFLSKSKNLKTLKLRFNCLSSWVTNPVSLAAVSSLEYLDLVGNTFCNNESFPMKPRIEKLKLGRTYTNFTNLRTLFIGAPIYLERLNKKFNTFSAYGIEYDKVERDSIAVLSHLPKLINFSLAYTGIRRLDLNAFCGMKLLELNLGINEIGEISYNGNRRKRQTLHLSPQYIDKRQYPEARFDPRKTSSLILRRNSISNLQNYPFKCFNYTTYLDLSYNRINYILHDTFKAMKSLKVLNLQYNPLRYVDEHAFKGVLNLNELKFENTAYQEEFTLKFLLDCPSNFILHFRDVASNVYRLLSAYRQNSTYFNNVIFVDFSNIAIPPYDVLHNIPVFLPFPNLTQLKIVGANFLYPLGNNFFGGISHVQKLTVVNCGLKEFPYRAIKNLLNLTYLDLSHNELEMFEKDSFVVFKNLKTLNLSHNFISKITPGTFRSLSRQGVANIVLNHNRITDVGLSIIDKDTLTRLSYLDLRKNLINCHCSMAHSFGWLIQSTRTKLDLPGFLPVCSDAVDNYHGGCLTCGAAKLSQPPSLFIYSSSFICQERFLEILTCSFAAFIIIFTAFPLLCKSKFIKRRIINSLTQSIGLQLFQEKERQLDCSYNIYAYDAFICFDKADISLGDWVDHVMLPTLETGCPSFRVEVMGKEDWCGTTQVKQLLLRMEASRKTVVLLSDKFSHSPQCRYIVSVLEEWLHMYGVDRSILVTFGQAPRKRRGLSIRQRRNPLSVLNFPGLNQNDDDDVMFWEMLKLSLSYRHECPNLLDHPQDLALHDLRP